MKSNRAEAAIDCPGPRKLAVDEACGSKPGPYEGRSTVSVGSMTGAAAGWD